MNNINSIQQCLKQKYLKFKLDNFKNILDEYNYYNIIINYIDLIDLDEDYLNIELNKIIDNNKFKNIFFKFLDNLNDDIKLYNILSIIENNKSLCKLIIDNLTLYIKDKIKMSNKYIKINYDFRNILNDYDNNINYEKTYTFEDKNDILLRIPLIKSLNKLNYNEFKINFNVDNVLLECNRLSINCSSLENEYNKLKLLIEKIYNFIFNNDNSEFLFHEITYNGFMIFYYLNYNQKNLINLYNNKILKFIKKFQNNFFFENNDNIKKKLIEVSNNYKSIFDFFDFEFE